MKKKSFLLYFDNLPWVRALGYEQMGRLLEALFLYGAAALEKGTGPEEFLEGCDGMAADTRMVFGFMAGNIRRDTERWRRAEETKALRKSAREALACQPEEGERPFS